MRAAALDAVAAGPDDRAAAAIVAVSRDVRAVLQAVTSTRGTMSPNASASCSRCASSGRKSADNPAANYLAPATSCKVVICGIANHLMHVGDALTAATVIASVIFYFPIEAVTLRSGVS